MLPTILRREGLGSLLESWFDDEFPITTGGSFSPRIDIYEDQKNVYVEAELPGIPEKDISLELDERNILTIKGERKQRQQEREHNYYRLEQQYGAFTRKFSLGDQIAGSKAKAEYINGELKVTIPKQAAKKPKSITIDVRKN